MNKILYILFAAILTTTSINSQWTWLNSSPQGNNLTDVVRLDNGYLLSSGRCGTILLSTNSGANWNATHRIHDTTTSIVSICRVNDNLIFAASFDSRILRSTNLGMNWESISRINPSLTNLVEINFIDQDNGFVLFNYTTYKTTNGGFNWFLASVLPKPCVDISFININTGFAVGGAVIDQSSQSAWIYKTTNSGLNWFDLPVPELGPIPKAQFINGNTGYISTLSNMYKTTNAGINWNVINIPAAADKVTDFIFFDENTAYAGTYNSHFLKTTNGGVNWNSIIIPYTTFNSYSGITSMYFTNLLQGFILMHDHLLFKTDNGGANWTKLTSSMNLYTPLTSIEFLDENNVILGGWGTTNDFVIRKSVNGGLNWTGVIPYDYQSATGYIYDLDFPSFSTGYAVGSGNSKGYLYKSTNAGSNWLKIDSVNSGSLRKVYFLNDNTGFMLGYAGEIFKTTNGGSNWSTFNSGITYGLSSIFFVNPVTGYACGGSPAPKLFKTIDSGNSWNQIYSTTGTTFNDINFINPNTGFITGKNIMKTTDAGVTWNNKTPGSTSFYQKTFFSSNNTGYTFGSYGKVVKTTNMGEDWSELIMPTDMFFNDIYFLNDNTGYLVGDQGMILKTTNGGGNFFVGISDPIENIPSEFVLHQNFPNPFNPVTTIKFSIPEISFVKISIYDVLGKEVARLVNENRNPGTHELNWDAAIFSSGVYFYELRAGEFTERKKMVLVK